MDLNPQLTFAGQLIADTEKISIAYGQLKVLSDIRNLLAKEKDKKAAAYLKTILTMVESKRDEVRTKLITIEDEIRKDIRENT